MYVEVKNPKKFIEIALEKGGSYRQLSKILTIPRASLLAYSQGRFIPKERFNKINKFIGNKEFWSIKTFENNWKQKSGGKNSVDERKKLGIYYSQLKTAQKKGKEGIKKWHKENKENNPKKYYLMQYSKFKKIGEYKYKTKRGKKVRNSLEKEIADILYNMKINYEYEPLVNIGKKYFFPDFLIENRIIIECTMWKGETKAYKLKEKIDLLKKKYKTYVVIPKDLYRYYKILDKNLIKGMDFFVPVAQTFRVVKCEEGSNW